MLCIAQSLIRRYAQGVFQTGKLRETLCVSYSSPLAQGSLKSALCPVQLWGSRNSNPSPLFYHFPGGVASAAAEFFTHLSKICARLLEFVEKGAYNKEVNDIIIGGSFS